MTFKVVNAKLAGKLVGVSTEDVLFDANGVGEIQSEDIYKDIISLPNFFPFSDEDEAKAKEEAEAAAKAAEEARAAEEAEAAKLKAEQEAAQQAAIEAAEKAEASKKEEATTVKKSATGKK